MINNNLKLSALLTKQLTTLVEKTFNPKLMRSIYLIGSFARNEMTPESDLDLLIIARKNFSYEIRKKLFVSQEFYKLDSELPRNFSGGLSPIIMEEEILKKEPSLIRKVMREGILLKGENLSEYLEFKDVHLEEKKDPKEFLKLLNAIEINF